MKRVGVMILLMACGTTSTPVGVQLMVRPGRPPASLNSHPTLDRTRAAAVALTARNVPIRFELFGARPESVVAEALVAELQGVADALEELQVAEVFFKQYVAATLTLVVIRSGPPRYRTREVHYGVEASTHDSEERSPSDAGVLRVYAATQEVIGAHDVLAELRRAYVIERARRMRDVPLASLSGAERTEWLAYASDAVREGPWSFRGAVPRRQRYPGWRATFLRKVLEASQDWLEPELQTTMDSMVMNLATDDGLSNAELIQGLADRTRARWLASDPVLRMRYLQEVLTRVPEAATTDHRVLGISLSTWVRWIAAELSSSDMGEACSTDVAGPTWFARLAHRSPLVAEALLREPMNSSTVARLFEELLAAEVHWIRLVEALPDEGAWAPALAGLARCARDGSASSQLEGLQLEGVLRLWGRTRTVDARTSLLRLLAVERRDAPDAVPLATAEELVRLAREDGLFALARAIPFAEDGVNIVALASPYLERWILGGGESSEARAIFELAFSASARFGAFQWKYFADALAERSRESFGSRAADVERLRRTLQQRFEAASRGAVCLAPHRRPRELEELSSRLDTPTHRSA